MDRHALLKQVTGLGNTYPGLTQMPREAQYLIGCRSFPQFCSTFRTIAEPGHFCVFCNPKLGKNQPFDEDGDWYIKESDFPVKGTAISLLIIPKQHVAPPDDDFFAAGDGDSVFTLFNKARGRYGIKGGGLVMRFGEPHLHAGTIPHCHVNVLVPDNGDKPCEPPLSKVPEDWRTNFARLRGHMVELDLRGGLEWMFSPEGIEATKQ